MNGGNIRNRRVLVTGGAGYVGSHTCKALAKGGFTPVVVDDLSSGRREFVQWGPLYCVNIADRALLAEILGHERPLACMHFAATIDVGLSMHDPSQFYRNNLIGTLELLEALCLLQPPIVVFSSTAAVYGAPREVPIPEGHPTEPINPYGDTKLAVERALRWYGEAYGLKWAALRYFNAAGADPEGDIGEAHEPETHLIPLVIGAALGTRPPVKVFGNDFDTPDGSPIRDYVHVADLATAHVQALERLLDGCDNTVANLGTGSGSSVHEVLRAVGRVAGLEVPYEQAPRRPGDPTRLIADPSHARKTLGWNPTRSDLNYIVETAINWHSRAG